MAIEISKESGGGDTTDTNEGNHKDGPPPPLSHLPSGDTTDTNEGNYKDGPPPPLSHLPTSSSLSISTYITSSAGMEVEDDNHRSSIISSLDDDVGSEMAIEISKESGGGDTTDTNEGNHKDGPPPPLSHLPTSSSSSISSSSTSTQLGKRVIKQPERYGHMSTKQATTSTGRISVEALQIGLKNGNGTMCYMNGMLRLWFYASGGSLESLVEKVAQERSTHGKPIDDFIQQLDSLWVFFRNGKKNRSSYCMKALFKSFQDLYDHRHRGLSAFNWNEQQFALDFFMMVFNLLFPSRNDADANDGFGVCDVIEKTYTECSVCSFKQTKSSSLEASNFMIANIDASAFGPNKLKINFLEMIKLKPVEVISQQCSDCVSRIKSNPKRKHDGQSVDAAEQLNGLRMTRECHFKTKCLIDPLQQFVLITIPKLHAHHQNTQSKHIPLPPGKFELPNNGYWEVWAVLLYTGKRCGVGSSGHYYVITADGKFDDENVYYDADFFNKVKRNGYINDENGTSAYIDMLVLKSVPSSNPLLSTNIVSSFHQNNYVVLDAFKERLFMPGEEKLFGQFDNYKANLQYTSSKFIPGDRNIAKKRFYLFELQHEWIEEKLIPRIKAVCGMLIPTQCTSFTYTIIYAGNSFQEPHYDGGKPGVSFLFSIKKYSEPLYILMYDFGSFNEEEQSIGYSKLQIPEYHCVMFKSDKFLHGGGIHKEQDPRIFVHFKENASDNDFHLVSDVKLTKLLKEE
jgi:hypothetical protein